MKQTNSSRLKLDRPDGVTKILLHSCCAPCSGEVIEAMVYSGLDVTVFFYNPNIHPRTEYELRKDENRRFCETLKIPCIDADYDTKNWFLRAKGMEMEPERGKRCTMCFDMRFERTALYAHENDFKVFTSSLGISRWKNMEQINGSGVKAAGHYNGLEYWTYNWRKKGGANRMIEISRREEFYQQEYCGCVYSLRDTNEWRLSRGKEKIKIGVKYYGRDEENESCKPCSTKAKQPDPSTINPPCASSGTKGF
jgi:predicted adenine nucleotide alpha hydrolase (AANH) superfamily ATPase